MRVSRNGKNAFSLKEVTEITGIKPAMVNFLIRDDYLRPSYREDQKTTLAPKSIALRTYRVTTCNSV
jgi:hypothetical protein